MQNTVSIRSGMRWWLCSALLLVGACTTTARYYVPSDGEERLSSYQVRDQAEPLLNMQCPRLLNGGRSAMGQARIMTDLDRSGNVVRARVARSSGDQAMDDIFGALLARLKVDPPSGMTKDVQEHPIYIGFSCAPENSAITLNITGIENPRIPPDVPPPPPTTDPTS